MSVGEKNWRAHALSDELGDRSRPLPFAPNYFYIARCNLRVVSSREFAARHHAATRWSNSINSSSHTPKRCFIFRASQTRI